MNYIKELNAFYDWLEINLLSTSAIALWHGLMHINNKAGWAEEFTVAASVLCIKTGLSDRTIRNARNELKQKGRIDWKTRKGNQSAVYKMISLFDDVSARLSETIADKEDSDTEGNGLSEINTDNVSVSVSDNTSDSVSGNASTLNKLNKTKLDIINTNTENEVLNSDKEFSEIAKLYQQVIGQPNAFTSDWINDALREFGFTWVKNAFMEADSQGGRSKAFVMKILNNWKSWGGMKLSTDKANQYKSVKSPQVKTKFHNFESRSEQYTADQLEEAAKRKRREAIERMKAGG